MTKLERNVQLYDVLWDLRRAYRTGDFSSVNSQLAEDCIYESMWVLEPLRGKQAVSDHLAGKGRSLQKSGNFPHCRIVELVGNINPLPESDIVVNGEKKRAALALTYESGKYCLMMEQEKDGETNGVLLDLKLTDEGKISRIDLCMPELFQMRGISEYITVCPANGNDMDDEEFDVRVLINQSYFGELYTFFYIVGEEFDENDDQIFSMDKWKEMLSCWKRFIAFESYDAAAENLAGIHYDTWTVDHQEAHEQLCRSGAKMWKRRFLNSVMLDDLLEWTQKYGDKYDSIHTIGW